MPTLECPNTFPPKHSWWALGSGRHAFISHGAKWSHEGKVIPLLHAGCEPLRLGSWVSKAGATDPQP